MKQVPSTKRCTICDTAHPRTIEYFYTAGHNKDGSARFYSRCKKCHSKITSAISMKWQKANPERHAANQKRWLAENKDKSKEYKKTERYAEANRRRVQKWAEAHPDLYRESVRRRAKRWKAKNPEKVKAMAHKRRSLSRKIEHNFTGNDWNRALEYFRYTCAVCGRPKGLWHTLSVDHWIPISKGGSTTPDNIVPLCHGVDGCNNRKGDKDAETWLVEQFGKRQAKQITERIKIYFEQAKSKVS